MGWGLLLLLLLLIGVVRGLWLGGEGEVVGLESGFWIVVVGVSWGVVGRGNWGRGGGGLVPWSLGLVEEVRRGSKVVREGRRRRVVQNMVDDLIGFVSGGWIL